MAVSTKPLTLRVSAWPYESRNLVDVVRGHAERSPQGRPFTFIDYSGTKPADLPLDHETLDRRARQVAALLQARGKPGDRVLLLYPAGLDYLCALFGCLYAGMVAVPAYPPLNPRLRDRLAAVAEDCAASAALTTRQTLEELGDETALLPPLARVRWLATDVGLESLETMWREPQAGRDELAILQYTSGSTGTPKGVMVTHGNLLHNVHAIALHLQFCPDDHHLTWLPPYHDMGLMGALLGSYCAGVPVSFMAPAAFLRRPDRWLREISRRRCTVSGAPNFAYELCVQKIADNDLNALDLSSWELAYSGAEPVRAATLDRFSRRFCGVGFRRQAFYPCYGMAETTLFVTGKRRDEAPRTLLIDEATYSQDLRAVVPDDTAPVRPALPIVSCGEVATGFDLVIVDPDTGLMLPDGRVGEILVAGPSVAAGYWCREADTVAAFHASVNDRAARYLRTGDLGFVHEGELYVSGRLKDLIILRGVNHYPHDIERTVDLCHEAIRPSCGIAFSVTVGNEEQLVFVQEIGKRDDERAGEIFARMREAIYTRHGVQPYALVLIESGTIPKTTSGKLSRRPCRSSYLEGRLAVIVQWRNLALGETASAEPASPLEASL
jgi:acyl-CoA synthetase (AMP-forming)/AMP-acid ligase II